MYYLDCLVGFLVRKQPCVQLSTYRRGGKTPLSRMFHALILLCIVLWAGETTAQIPNAVLGGILIQVGSKIIDWSFLWRICQVSMRATLVTYGVLLLTVFVDLVTAVVVGAFVANILTIHRLTSIQVDRVRAILSSDDELIAELTPEECQLLRQVQERGRVILVHMSGPMSYGAARTIAFHMGQNFDVLILDLTNVPLIGVTAAMTIEAEIKAARRQKRGEIFLVGISGQVKERLRRFRVQDTLPAENFLPSCYCALNIALNFLDTNPSEPGLFHHSRIVK